MAIKTISGEIKSAHGKPLKFFAKGNDKLREYLKTAKSIPYSVDVTLYEDKADVEARRKATARSSGGWPTDTEILRMLNNDMCAAARTAENNAKLDEFGIKKPEMANDRLAQFRTVRGVFEAMGMSRAEATAETERSVKFTEAEAIADGEATDEADEESAE